MDRAIESKANDENPPVNNKSVKWKRSESESRLCFKPDFVWGATVPPSTLNLLEPDHEFFNKAKYYLAFSTCTLSAPSRSWSSAERLETPPEVWGSLWNARTGRLFPWTTLETWKDGFAGQQWKHKNMEEHLSVNMPDCAGPCANSSTDIKGNLRG